MCGWQFCAIEIAFNVCCAHAICEEWKIPTNDFNQCFISIFIFILTLHWTILHSSESLELHQYFNLNSLIISQHMDIFESRLKLACRQMNITILIINVVLSIQTNEFQLVNILLRSNQIFIIRQWIISLWYSHKSATKL